MNIEAILNILMQVLSLLEVITRVFGIDFTISSD